jgi:uncharacterized protein
MLPSWLTLPLVMIAVALIWSEIIILLMAHALLRPKRMTDARALVKLRRLTPGDLGLEFEEISFDIRDLSRGEKLKIAAWWLPHAAGGDRCAVLIHGYSDAKVGAIAWAPLLASLGFHILALDLRAHGQSGGIYCTAGFWERSDLNQVIDLLKAGHPQQTRQTILFGISLGAAVAAAAAVDRDDLSAVILESPYAEYSHATSHQSERLGLPGPLFQRAALKAAQKIARCDFSAVSPIKMIPKIPCPLMVISSGDDPFVPPVDLAAIKMSVQSRGDRDGPSVYWGIDQVHHVLGMAHDPHEYTRKISEFLSQALEPNPMRISP